MRGLRGSVGVSRAIFWSLENLEGLGSGFRV